MGDALTRLADAVEAGTWLGYTAEFWGLANHMLAFAAFNGSLDAAKALHEAVLPEWDWDVASSNAAAVFHGRALSGPYEMTAALTPARAWLLAILRALAQVQK